jgi:CheY-like chemotaxis protein
MTAERPVRKLLVVDDEPLVRQTLSLVLQDEYEITAVGSGEEAIEASLKESFPVVILDLCMEGLSGIETLQRLKQIREKQNVIILTAYESMESAIAALNLGAFNYLTKPFERLQLKTVISRGFEVYERDHIRQQDMQQRLMGVHDSFFALLCHEFNTPLNVILGFSELLASNTEDREYASWVRHITEAGSHLHDILMEIVDYIAASHLAAAGVEKAFVPGNLLLPIVQSFRDKNIAVELDTKLSTGARLSGPSEAIFMIVRKLVRLASQRSSKVRVATRIEILDGPNLTIVVSGTGIRQGTLAGEDVGRLFEPYQFAPTEGSSCAMSLGLELATCRKIAEYAHASVEGRFNPEGELELVTRIPVQVLRSA